MARRERLSQLTTRSAAGPQREDRSTAPDHHGSAAFATLRVRSSGARSLRVPSSVARSLSLAGLLGLALLGCGDGKRSGSEPTGDPQAAATATEVDEGSILPAERR
ncbi:MAG TPA: hypothetical protein PLI18_09805, partial [Pirellulaceae bacterium]|nr:hypothetical protein [Pirellulaceae bacterium]